MIPQKLTLSNFMCYRQPTELDFSDIHLACLTGDNGHGKSALLDAMTWALWGKARARSSDELVSTGERDMSVWFAFSLDDVQYRVLRSRELSGKSGKGSLELQTMWESGWAPLTSPTMRQTQDQINALLRMDYDTFINSAFLVQGRADEFTVKQPAERKQVLSDILGLSFYDRYAEAARLRAREHKREQEGAEARIEVLQEELTKRTTWEEELEAAQAEAASVAASIKAKQTEIERLEAAEKKLVEQRSVLDAVTRTIRDLQEQERTLAEQTSEHRSRAEGAQAILDRKDEITEGYGALVAARHEVAVQTGKLAELRPLAAERSRLDAAIVARRHVYELKSQAEVTELRQRVSRLDELIAEQQARIDRIGGIEGVCPVCEQGLDPQKQAELVAGATDKQAGLTTARAAARAELETLQRQHLEPPCDADLAPDESAALAVLVEQIAAIGYDVADAQQARDRGNKLLAFEEEWISLGKAEATLAEVNRAIEQAKKQQSELARRLQGEAVRRLGLDAEIKQGQEDTVFPLAAAKSRMIELRGNERAVLDTLGALQERLNRLNEQQVKLDKEKAKLTEAAEQHTLYTDLQQAFGPNGVQALIIDAAIPELEVEANALLGRMTEGRMSVQLETQRDTKSGTIRETLDILIADEHGARNYELFSGGEAFRINFAIRIALSKLLARRAGAQLRTLIIDEGFGTQDAMGRTNLVAAINSVAEGFARILVVTHIEELKDAFPVRIDVCKTPRGSQVTINEG